MALVAIGAAAYFNSLRGPFVFDDKSSIAENSAIRHWRPIGPILAGPRPVVDLTFALNYSFGRLNVYGYHLLNLAIHILAALALFGIVRRTLTMPVFAGRFDDPAATVLGFCAALIWMLHPLQTEAVTYLIQRTESLMGLFCLLTLYALIRAASSPRPAAWSVAAIAVCALGMGCKEVMVTAPAALLLYDRTFIAGSFGEALRRRWGLYLALTATWLILVRSILAAFSPHTASAGFALAGVTPFAYARSELGVVLHYLALAFWPVGLCLDYGWPIAVEPKDFVPGAIIVGGLLAVTLWAVVRRPTWGFAGAWFFLILAPTSSFLPIRDLAVEHRMYLPLAALAVAAVVAAYLLAERLLRRPGESQEPRRRLALWIAAFLALCAAAGLGYMTLQRNAQYRSEISIWEDATSRRPANPRAWSNLGEGYVNASRYDEAIRSCEKAIDLDSKLSPAYYNLGLAFAGIGRPAEAIRDYDKSIALTPDFAAAYNGRGVAYAQTGHPEEAIRDYDAALQLNSDNIQAYINRGNALTQLGRPADAIQDYDRALRRKADFAEAYYNRAIADSRLGRRDEAIRDYTQLIKLNPENASAYNGRGKALADAGRPAEAIRDFDQAIALNPGYAEAYYHRGNTLADANRHAEAIRDYDRAIALKPDFAAAYNNRAVAYYEIMAYDKARADVETFMRLGGKPDPAFLKLLGQASGPAK